MQFDLVDIRLFVNVAETNSVRRGAELSNMCASAASKRIRSVEDEIGTSLLYRSAAGVSLTPAGQAFHQHSLILLHDLEDLERDLWHYSKSPNSTARGTIRVSAGNALVSEFLPAVLRQYSAVYPNVNIEVRSELCPEIAHAVNLGLADVGIYVGTLPASDTDAVPYGRYRMVLIASRHHAIAQQKKNTIDFSDTLDYDYVTLPENSASHAAMKRAAEVTGKPLRVRFQLPTFADLRRMVESNLGIAVVPEFLSRRLSKEICVMNLSDEWAVCDMWICTRKGSAPHTVKDFVELLVAHAPLVFRAKLPQKS